MIGLVAVDTTPVAALSLYCANHKSASLRLCCGRFYRYPPKKSADPLITPKPRRGKKISTYPYADALEYVLDCVEHSGLEPLTSTLPVLRSTRWANTPLFPFRTAKLANITPYFQIFSQKSEIYVKKTPKTQLFLSFLAVAGYGAYPAGDDKDG